MDAGAGGGNCAGLVAVAAVLAAVTLSTVHFYSCLETEFRKKIQLQHGAVTSRGTMTATKKKKVRFADDVVEPSSNSEEYRRRSQRSTVLAGQT